MGIVNVNDDSFSGDGTLDIDAAISRAQAHVLAGADIIDVGAESARTNRGPVPVDEEVRRLRGFLERWATAWQALRPRDDEQVWPPVLSVNTWRPDVVEAVLTTGAIDLLNDIGALPDDRNATLCADHGTALLIMHSVGAPKVPHLDQRWNDIVGSMLGFFEEKLAMAMAAGVPHEALIVDPGLDFAKQCDDNLAVLRDLFALDRFGRPVLVPLSRKTFIGEVLGIPDPQDRDAGTIACMASCMPQGDAGRILRVHHSDAAWQALKTLAALG
ncbi:MAG: dihydropteroate synthase [Verrucomicrobia bacterium]|nr:dihydropteroate synthase [Verrucomicrobiota bacterium]